MERSRWISPRLDKNGTIDSGQYHPSFTLTYFKEGKPVLVLKVVGKIHE
jgi:hypothetical protein